MSAVPLVERQPSPMGETSVQEAVNALPSDVNADAANLLSDANTETAAQVARHSDAHTEVVVPEAVTASPSAVPGDATNPPAANAKIAHEQDDIALPTANISADPANLPPAVQPVVTTGDRASNAPSSLELDAQLQSAKTASAALQLHSDQTSAAIADIETKLRQQALAIKNLRHSTAVLAADVAQASAAIDRIPEPDHSDSDMVSSLSAEESLQQLELTRLQAHVLTMNDRLLRKQRQIDALQQGYDADDRQLTELELAHDKIVMQSQGLNQQIRTLRAQQQKAFQLQGQGLDPRLIITAAHILSTATASSNSDLSGVHSNARSSPFQPIASSVPVGFSTPIANTVPAGFSASNETSLAEPDSILDRDGHPLNPKLIQLYPNIGTNAPKFQSITTVPPFHGIATTVVNDRRYFDIMRNTLTSAGLWVAVCFPLPLSWFALTAACYSALASSCQSTKAKHLCKIHRINGDTDPGNPIALWQAMQTAANPTNTDATAAMRARNETWTIAIVNTSNPVSDWEKFTAKLDAHFDFVDTLSLDHWIPPTDQLIQHYLDNVPSCIRGPGIMSLYNETDPDNLRQTISNLINTFFRHNNHIAPTANHASPPYQQGGRRNTRQPHKEPITTSTKPKTGDFCTYAGHRKPSDWKVGDTYYTVGHHRRDCLLEKAHKADPSARPPHGKPPPGRCHICNKHGHKKWDCPQRQPRSDHPTANIAAVPPAPPQVPPSAPAPASHLPPATAATAQPPAAARQFSAPTTAPTGFRWTLLPTVVVALSFLLEHTSAASTTATAFVINTTTDFLNTSPFQPVNAESSIFAVNDDTFTSAYTVDDTNSYNTYHCSTINDTGATYSIANRAHVEANEGNCYEDWTTFDPSFQPSGSISFGNRNSAPIRGAVGRWTWHRNTDGTFTERLDGPILVADGPVHLLQSTRSHCKLHNATVTMDATSMTCHYPDGTSVRMVDNGNNLFLVPSCPPPPHHLQQPRQLPQSLMHSDIVPFPTHSSTAAHLSAPLHSAALVAFENMPDDNSQIATVTACLVDVPRRPGEPLEVSFRRILSGIGYEGAQLDDELKHFNASHKLQLSTTTTPTTMSSTYQNFCSRFGYRNHQTLQKLATILGVKLTQRDTTFATHKLFGSATIKPLRPRPDPLVEPHVRSSVSLDPVNGMPPSHEHHYTTTTFVTAPTGRARVYFSKTDTITTADMIKALDTYLVDSGFVTPAVRYGPQLVRTDSAAVFKSPLWEQHVKSIYAKPIMSASYGGKAQNHAIEGKIRVLCQMMLSMLHSMDTSGLNIDPLSLWPYAVTHACYIDSVLPSLTTGVSPHQLETGCIPDYSLVRTFGIQVGVAQTKEQRNKPDPHIRLGIYLGVAPNSHPDTAIVLMLDTLKTVHSRDVYYDPNPKLPLMPTIHDYDQIPGTTVFDPTNDTMMIVTQPTPPPLPPTLPTESATTSTNSPLSTTTPMRATRSTPKVRRPPKGGELFQLDQQVSVDYGAEGIHHGIVDVVRNDHIRVFFPNEGANGTRADIPRAQFDSVTPTPQPRSNNPTANAILTSLHDCTSAVRNVFSQLASLSSSPTQDSQLDPDVTTTMTMTSKPLAPVMLLAAALMTAIAPDTVLLAAAYNAITTDNTDDQDTLYNSNAFAAGAVPASKAMRSPERQQWIDAGTKELNGLIENQVWSDHLITDIPQDSELIDTNMIYAIKRSGLKKGRFCCLGNQSQPYVSWFNRNAATPTLTCIRIFCCSAVKHNLRVTSFDFTQAFSSCPLDNDKLYIRFPEAYRKYMYEDGIQRSTPTYLGERGTELVGWLRKSLYGAVQSMYNYNERLASLLTNDGFERSQSDPCLFNKTYPDGTVIRICAYVDDLLIAASIDSPHYDHVVRLLQTTFKTTGGDPVEEYLGARITQDLHQGSITIDQQAFIESTCHDFLGTVPPKTPDTVLPNSFVPSSADCPTNDADKRHNATNTTKFRTILGKLQWIAGFTRPDISHATSVLGQFSANPGKSHMDAIKHLCHYLLHTSTRCIHYRSTRTVADGLLEGFVDADWATCRDSRRSRSGFIATLQSGPVAWRSSRQLSVAMSTMESELLSLTAGSLTTLHLRRLCEDVGLPQPQPTPMFEDNTAAIQAATNTSISSSSRHIAIRHFKIKELIEDNEIIVHHIKSANNLADLLTKNVNSVTLATLLPLLLGYVP